MSSNDVIQLPHCQLKMQRFWPLLVSLSYLNSPRKDSGSPALFVWCTNTTFPNNKKKHFYVLMCLSKCEVGQVQSQSVDTLLVPQEPTGLREMLGRAEIKPKGHDGKRMKLRLQVGNKWKGGTSSCLQRRRGKPRKHRVTVFWQIAAPAHQYDTEWRTCILKTSSENAHCAVRQKTTVEIALSQVSIRCMWVWILRRYSFGKIFNFSDSGTMGWRARRKSDFGSNYLLALWLWTNLFLLSTKQTWQY